MKMPIAWHEECLTNITATLAHAEAARQRAEEDVYRLRKEIEVRRAQIAEARQRGMKAFDADKLLKKRSKG